MSIRRKEILKELGLLPQWHNTLDGLKDSIPTPPLIKKDQHKKERAGDISNEARRDQILHMNWSQLKKEVTNCTACTLCQARTHTVFGTGDENADWLYIGEGPGAREDATGEPFVGQAGKLLDNMLMAIGLQRGHHVYIANIVKCRPPNNRNPDSTEVRQCEPYLARQIELVKPKVIIALGKVAAQSLLGLNDNISSLRGKLHTYSGIPLIVTYHPAYLLRSLPDKAKAWEDLCFAKATMQSLAWEPVGLK
ncbi:MAG: uracil-DNA glycosylase [Nitrosomonas sp.]|nr:uracil-DNA glycosylase [Nitrosomonas sp.]